MPGEVRVLVYQAAHDAQQLAAVRAAYHQVSRRMAGVEGMLGNELLRSPLDPTALAVLSRWESMEAFRRWEQGAEHRHDTAPLRAFRDTRTSTPFAVYEVDAAYGPGVEEGEVDAVDAPRLGFVGLGNMGGGMAAALLSAGCTLTVHNRTAAKAGPLVDAGARLAGSAAEAAEGQQVVMLSLADENAVEEVLFGQVVPVLEPGARIIDTSTVSPEYARQAARRLAEHGLHRVEACVVGNPLQARKGELRVYTAGDEEHVKAVRPVLDLVGNDVVHMGPPGAAADMKLILNLLLGAQVASLAEALAYGVAAGLERDLLLASVSQTGFSSMVMRFRADLMRRREYEPAFFRAELMEKDVRLAVEAAAAGGVDMPLTAALREQFAAVVAAGDGDKDASVLVEHRTQT